MSKLHDMEQKRDNIARQMRSLNDKIGENSEASEEQRDQFNHMKHELRDLDFKIDAEKEMRRLDAQDAESQKAAEDETRALHDAKKDGNVEYRDAFEAMMRFGKDELTNEQRQALSVRAQSVGTDTAGGHTVPDEFQSRVIEAMKAYGGVANHCNILNTPDGRTLEWSTTDGTADIGDFIAENAKAGTQDVVFGSVTLGAKKLTSKTILVSNELLQDTGVPLDSLLAGRIGSRLGRAEAKYIIQGNGSGLQNSGLDSSVTGKTSLTTAGAFTWKDINALVHSVDPAYRAMDSFAIAMNDATLRLVEEMEDKDGRPLWLPAVAGMAPATVLGVPYFIDQGIKAGTGTNNFMYAGDWKKFLLRRVGGVQLKRLGELHAESDQTGFLGFHRFDTALEDTAAIKALAWK